VSVVVPVRGRRRARPYLLALEHERARQALRQIAMVLAADFGIDLDRHPVNTEQAHTFAPSVSDTHHRTGGLGPERGRKMAELPCASLQFLPMDTLGRASRSAGSIPAAFCP
jgi:hypothetical protein